MVHPDTLDVSVLLVSGSVFVVSCLVLYQSAYLYSSQSSIPPTKFYEEKEEDQKQELPKNISLEDAMTVETVESAETVDEGEEPTPATEDEDTTLVTGSATRREANITETAEVAVKSKSTPLPKKIRRAARKLLGISKPAPKVPATPAAAAGSTSTHKRVAI